jgi:formylglycine-generating enzyme required for sulfatase activity
MEPQISNASYDQFLNETKKWQEQIWEEVDKLTENNIDWIQDSIRYT